MIEEPRPTFGMDEPALKERYAKNLFMGMSAFNAALNIWHDNNKVAYLISLHWPEDEYVKRCLINLRKEDIQGNQPPSKGELAAEIYEAAKMSGSQDAKMKAYRLVCEMLGYIEKPAVNNNVAVTTVQQNRVMVMRDHGDDNDWENKAITQQARLLHGAAADNG